MSLRPEPPSRAEALRYWFKLGWISFGGPAGQIAMMHEELVERRRWISEGRFLHALNYCTVLPGPEAQQLATYIGWLLHGARGGIAAGALFIAPSLLILIALSWIYLNHGQAPAVIAVLGAVKPAVVAIVLAAAARLGSRTLRHPWAWLVALAAFVAVALLKVPFPLVIAAAAIAGTVIGRLSPSSVAGPATRAAAGAGTGAAAAGAGSGVGLGSGPVTDHVIGDHDPPPPHARFRLGIALLLVALGLLLAVAVHELIKVLLTGNGATALDLAWFHTKAALVGFGGAYAVLPYIYATAVDQFHWLTADQMIDGLALGESTPGPLIMIVVFVGFVAGWTTQFAADGMPLLSALCGALITTFFTFLPSFLFILAGAPFIEGTRHKVGLKGPLAGITAAVVGVMLSLALFFAGHVFITREQRFDWIAIAVAAVALALLTRWKVGVLTIIGLAAAFGLLRWWA
ncbi:MAG TPA: chromate transporter [Burkholderiaceae bacterium]|nr:chromate transporter [Burkholderiaceae bacterium]